MWATSIGSTVSHRPVPGVRKSGIPEGTEMPAPGQRHDRARASHELGQAARRLTGRLASQPATYSAP